MKKANSTIRLFLAVLGFFLIGGNLIAQTDVNRTFNTGAFLDETGWEIVNTATNVVYDCEDAGLAPNAVPGTITLFGLPDGPYQVRGFDSFGDGWNGGSMTVTKTVGGTVLGDCLNRTHAGGGNNTCPGPSAGGSVVCSFVLCAPCTVPLSCPANINVSTDAGVCSAVVNFNILGNCSSPIQVNFPSGSTFPPGNTTVTAKVCNNSVETSCSFNVFVSDQVPPVVTCPADITLNLPPGACSIFYNYTVTASDNCPFLVPVVLTQNPPANNPAQAIDPAQSLNCGFAQTRFGRVFGGPGTGPFTIEGLQVGIRTGGGNYSFNIYEFTSGNVPAAGNANMTLLNTQFNTILPAVVTSYVPVTFPVPYTIGAGKYFFVEIISNQGNFTMGNILAADLPGQPSYIASAACGLPNFGTFASVGFPGLSLAFNVVGVQGGEPEIIQVSGLPSGEEFPIGVTTNCFEVTDVQGNVGSCCFDVTVREYPNPTNSLVCNDNGQVSLNENCQAVVGADDVLEGGPHGCYDTRYTVMVLSPLGAPLGNTVDITFINKTWTVKVTDNVTGQSCWGSIMVKDKLAPVLVCEDQTVSCSEDLTPIDRATAPIKEINKQFKRTPGNLPINNTLPPAEDQLTIDGGQPGTILDVDLELEIRHTWIGDMSVRLESPSGTQVTVWAGAGGCADDNLFVDFDDEGACNNACAAYTQNLTLQPVACLGIAASQFLSDFDGENINGEWELTVTDNVGGDNGTLDSWTLDITWLGQAGVFAPSVSDNCGPVTLTHEDSFVDGACGGPSGVVTRTWKAEDASGNTATCKQTITLSRPNIADVEIPSDIKWTCTQYDIFPGIIEPVAVHPYITDCDPATELLDATCYDASCDDMDFSFQDNASQNTTSNNGGCPGIGLDDADVLALTGSGYPSLDGRALVSICEIGIEKEDLWVQECAGTFKIIRRWTLIDWCSNPVAIRQENQVIKVVDEEAPVINLFGVDGKTVSNYGNSQIPALGNLGNPATTGGCGQEPQFSGGTVFTAHVDLQSTGAQFNPDQFTNIVLESVYLTLNHQKVEDLDIFLKGPSNKVIELSTDNGLNGVGYRKTKFVDDATVPVISAANSPFTGRYRPEGSTAISCGGFAGNTATLAAMTTNFQVDALGTWELIIFDDNEDNIGELVEWKLNFRFGDVTIDVYNSSATGSIHTVCEGSVLVPPIQDCTDNCSGIASYVTELWTRNAQGNPVNQIGTIAGNGGYFHNVPMFENGLPARYVVRYTAIDGCKNQSSLLMQIRLRDKVPPVAICDAITEVTVTNNGGSTGNGCSNVKAEVLDDGSYDNCTPVHFLMAKMKDSFSQDIYNRCYYPTRDFCCSDVGDNTVIVMVLDQDPTPLFNTTITTPTFGCHLPTPNTPSLFLPPNGLNFTVPGTNQLVPVNFSTCMVTITVNDKLPPVLVSCPPNERISCDLYASNFETQLANAAAADRCGILAPYFGTAVFYDNCVANVTCTTTISVNQCLEGTVRRTWTATDGAGNTNSSQNCTQTIFVDHVSDFVVEFPQHRNGESGHLPAVECGATLPDFGQPEVFYETCELIAVSFTDQLFTDEPGACYKIVRQWTVINWCVVGDQIDQEVVEDSELAMRLAGCLSIVNLECDLDGDGDCDDRTFRDSWRVCTLPNAAQATQATVPDTDPDSDPWDGYITYQQVIKVNDSVDPVFTNGCQIPDVCIESNICTATVLLPTPEVDDCSPGVVFTYQINIGGVWQNGAGPHLNVAPGQYPVRYIANDNCNNQRACETVLNVRDCKKPTPYCKTGIVVSLMPVTPPMVEVWASDLNDNSFDNCPGALKYSFSANVNDLGRTYTCDNLGQNTVQVWVTDAAGNQDFCVTNVFVQANMVPGQCIDDPQVVNVGGTAATEQGNGVGEVKVNVNSPSGFDVMAETGSNGAYTQAVSAGGDYTLTPVKDVEPLNGVTTYDLVVISKHILGVDLLDSPYQIIAADANRSNTVTTFDLVELRKLILYINTDFPNNTSWRFVDKKFVFPNPVNPFQTAFPEVISLNDVAASTLNNDFVAVKIGDVNGSATSGVTGTEDRNTTGRLVLSTDDIEVVAGGRYTVGLAATDFAVSGFQFTVGHSGLVFEGVADGLAGGQNVGTALTGEGFLTVSWNEQGGGVERLSKGETVLGLTFVAERSGRLSEMLNVNGRYTVSEAYGADGSLLDVSLVFGGVAAAGGFELYQNTPNPFAAETVVGFNLPEATSGTLTVSDVQGKVVKVVEKGFEKGYNQVVLKRSELGATGVLYYRLDTGTDSATRMMILVD